NRKHMRPAADLHAQNETRSSRVPRTRSLHGFAASAVANLGFKSGIRIIKLRVSFSIPKFAQRSQQMLANFGIGTLEHDPEKCVAVFGRRSCSNNELKRDGDSRKSHHALAGTATRLLHFPVKVKRVPIRARYTGNRGNRFF